MRWLWAVGLGLAVATAPAVAQEVVRLELIVRQVALDHVVIQENIQLKPADGAPAVFRFDLPPRASEVQLGEGLKRDGTAIVSTAPVSAPSEFRVMYRVPGDGKQIRIRRELAYPVRAFIGQLPEGYWEVEADGALVERGIVVGGTPTIRLTARALGAGKTVEIRVIHRAARQPIEKMFGLLAALIVVGFGLLVAGLALAQRQRDTQLALTRSYLERELATLEAAREAGQIQAEFADPRVKELTDLLGRS